MLLLCVLYLHNPVAGRRENDEGTLIKDASSSDMRGHSRTHRVNNVVDGGFCGSSAVRCRLVAKLKTHHVILT